MDVATPMFIAYRAMDERVIAAMREAGVRQRLISGLVLPSAVRRATWTRVVHEEGPPVIPGPHAGANLSLTGQRTGVTVELDGHGGVSIHRSAAYWPKETR